MIAIILAAGQGTRLLPFTRDHPKCLVEVAGRTILDRQIEALRAGGVTSILVVGGYRIDHLAAHLGAMDAATRPVLACNPFWAVSSSIGSVWTARDALTRDFCLLNGDTIFAPALMRDALGRAGDGVSLLVEPARAFAHDDMRVTVAGEAITHVGKALGEEATHRSLGVIVGRGAGVSAYRAALDAVIRADGGAQRFHHDVIAHLARTTHVAPLVAAGASWTEIDRPEDIARWHDR